MTDEALVEVQWYGRSSSGVRSYKLHGVSLVHLWTGTGRTLCGRQVPRPSKRTQPWRLDRRCSVCAKAAP